MKYSERSKKKHAKRTAIYCVDKLQKILQHIDVLLFVNPFLLVLHKSASMKKYTPLARNELPSKTATLNWQGLRPLVRKEQK